MSRCGNLASIVAAGPSPLTFAVLFQRLFEQLTRLTPSPPANPGAIDLDYGLDHPPSPTVYGG